MLCSSEDLCGSVGCSPSLFCVPTAAFNETMDGVVPGYITRSYVTPQRNNLLNKRQSQHQTYVKSKNSKLEHTTVVGGKGEDVVGSRTMTPSNMPVYQNLNASAMQPIIAPPRTTLSPQFSTSDSSSECTNSNARASRCDTLELHRARKLKSSKLQEKRRSVMESHFGSSMQAKNAFVQSNENGLQVARAVVYRSSSTACISPVRKTPIGQQNSLSCAEGKSVGNLLETNLTTDRMSSRIRSIKASRSVSNVFNESSSEMSSYYESINDVNVVLTGAPNNFTQNQQQTANLCSYYNNQQSAYRQRSKSFSAREILTPLSLSKTESHRVSSNDVHLVMNIHDGLRHTVSRELSNDTTCSPASSSSSGSLRCSSVSLNSHSPRSAAATNANNCNILAEAKMVENVDRPDIVKKKLKAARRKLKGTSKLSKSLHSLLPLGCTGSMTFQHDVSTVENDRPEALYQPISQCETKFQDVQCQQTVYHSTDKSQPKNTAMLVLRSYTKRKTAKSNTPDPTSDFYTASSANSSDTNSGGSNKHRFPYSLNKYKSKSQKALNKYVPPPSCVQTKDLWYNKLAQVIAEEKEGSPPTNIQVSYTDPRTSVEICKTVSITANTNARECITLILDHLEMRDVDVTKFQLWVKSSQEESPYPLIGHEFPLSIKYNGMRESNLDCNSEHFNNLYNNCNDIKFTLRAHGKVGSNGSSPENGKKVSKKARKSPIRNKLFKKSANKGDTVDGSSAAPAGILFGHPLYKLVEVNNGALPKPVLDMLTQLFQKGPFTEGIFRKSANARVVREMRDKLDSGCPSDLSEANITAVAALFKDFLRSLPDALLNCQLHDDWLDVPRLPSIRDQISRTLLLCSRLPRSNLLLLQHFLCVLHHITRRSKTNKMSASNLAVCVGPSVLWSSPPVLSFSAETTKQHSSIVEFLIDRFGDIFGEAMLRLMGDPPEHDPSAARQDSGAEETDSMHSCNGRRDDSSIDSLERDLEGLSPLPRKDKMSLTNLSRDSGLTMSDTQLYTPDEEESESTSSGHSSGDKSMPYNEHRPVERVSHYPAPNNPHAIYTAVCRRPEKQIAYDEQENYYATPSREHTRVQITYSSPSGMMDVAGHGYNQERLMDSQRTMCESEGIYSVPNTEHQLHLQEQLQEMEKMNSNFQRDDWMRRKSNLRKVSKTNSNEGGCLTRSTSEESLLSKCNSHEYGLSLSAGGPPPLTLPCEDRSRSPPSIEYDDNVGFMSRDSAIRRSRSAHYLAEVRREKLKDKSDEPSTIVRSSSQDTFSFLRSRSTPHIQDEGDRSYDSSTLSDDDSTPHVSRSNSRGKECGSTGAPSWDATLTPSDSGNSRNSSFKSERTGSVCTVVSAGSCSTLASNPPSYEEALNRRSIMQQQQFTEYAIREEKLKSARAKKLYAESVKQYQDIAFSAGDIVRASPAHIHDGDDIDSPPPLPPKGDPPPLPPKQRASRRGQNDSSSRLKHHPPVHVETQSRKQKLSNTPSPQSSGFGQTMHKTIIYTDVGPPNLPPKERTVIEVVESTSESDRVRQQTVRTVSPRQGVEKKSIETQTDDCDLGDSDDLRDEDSQTSDSWLSDHITSVHVPDSSFNYSTGQNRNTVSSGNNTSINNSNSNNNQNRSRGRPRRRDSSTSQRSRSVPSRDSVTGMHSASDSEDDEWEYPSPSHEYHSSSAAINYGLRDFRNLEADHRPELTWSVSQLRERFGESHRGAKVHPPPYRPPPNRAPITSYHLGAGDTFCRKTPSRPQSTYGEESYV